MPGRGTRYEVADMQTDHTHACGDRRGCGMVTAATTPMYTNAEKEARLAAVRLVASSGHHSSLSGGRQAGLTALQPPRHSRRRRSQRKRSAMLPEWPHYLEAGARYLFILFVVWKSWQRGHRGLAIALFRVLKGMSGVLSDRALDT